jgi:DNA-binding CsgD family transcriptional regulator
VDFAVEALASSPKIRAVDAHGLNLLSKRELEAIRGLSEGLTNREIAERLGMSEHTVKNYLFRVFDKLDVSGRVELLFMVHMNPQLVGVEMSAEELAELKRRLAEQRAAGEAALRRRLKRRREGTDST